MKHAILMATALWIAVVGLWDHDWILICSGAGLAFGWPFIAGDVDQAAELPREALQDDRDLAESA